MTHSNGNQINLLIGGFMDSLEEWEAAPNSFDWDKLQALAQDGAQAYNEGAGPSFHMLALDGVPHGEFHERFLNYSLEAGFDPFKLVKTGNGNTMTPVLSHSSLAEAARGNPFSARMQATLMALARVRFGETGQDINRITDANWLRTIEAAAESIPLDVLQRIAPELANRS